MRRPAGVLARGGLLVALTGIAPVGFVSGVPAQDPQAPSDGDSRVETFTDGRVLELAAGTVVRVNEAPAIDTTSEPDHEVVSLRTDVLFAFGAAELSPEAGAVVDEAVRQIEQLEPKRLVIVGHTDSVGSDTDNLALSEARAASVEAAIRSRLGGDAPSMEVEGRGETEPVAPNELPDGSDNPEGRALNRRVAVEVIS